MEPDESRDRGPNDPGQYLMEGGIGYECRSVRLSRATTLALCVGVKEYLHHLHQSLQRDQTVMNSGVRTADRSSGHADFLLDSLVPRPILIHSSRFATDNTTDKDLCE